MKAAWLSPVFVALALGIAAPSYAQGYNNYGRDQYDRGQYGGDQRDQSDWQNQYDRDQQAQLPDRRDYCSNLRRQDDQARYDIDHAQFRDDLQRAQDRVRRIDDQLWRNCS